MSSICVNVSGKCFQLHSLATFSQRFFIYIFLYYYMHIHAYICIYKLCLFVCSSTCFLFRCERFFSSFVLYKYFLRFLFREYYLVHTLCGCSMQRMHILMYVCVLCSGGCSADFQGFVCCVALAFIVIALLLFLLLLHILFDGFMIICLLLCCAFFVIYLSLVLQLLARFQRVCSVVVFVFITVVACLSCRINVKHVVINVLFAWRLLSGVCFCVSVTSLQH